MVERNYKDKLKMIKITMNQWLGRDLTPLGRNTVLKSLILPKLNHLFSVLPNPNDNIIKELNTLCFNFIWRQKPDKISRVELTKPFNEGGIRAPNIKNTILAQKTAWVRRLLKANKETKVLKLFHQNIAPNSEDYFLKSQKYIEENIITTRTNRFWGDVLRAWGQYISSKGANIENAEDVLTQPIWCNENITVNGQEICYKHYIRKGIVFANDILDDNGSFKNYESFSDSYKCKTNFLEYAGIVKAIKAYLKNKKLNLGNNSKLPYPIIPYFIENILKTNKGCRIFYDTLEKSNKISTYKNRLKWEKDLNLAIDLADWEEINNTPFSSQLGTKQIWFQYSIIHRILPLNDLLYKMKLKDTNICSLCNISIETLTHLFYECPKVQNIWKNLKTWIEEKTDSKLDFSRRNICLGYPKKRNMILNLIIITVKYNIYRSKLKGIPPKFSDIKEEITRIYETDKYICYSNCQSSKFIKFWYVCHYLFQE